MNRDFDYRGLHFHLNDNRIGISKANYTYFPKYKLMLWRDYLEEWHSLGCFDRKQDAIKYIKSQYNYL